MRVLLGKFQEAIDQAGEVFIMQDYRLVRFNSFEKYIEINSVGYYYCISSSYAL